MRCPRVTVARLPRGFGDAAPVRIGERPDRDSQSVLQELPLVARARQLRHTFVQGLDGKHYKILTFRFYERTPPPEFPNWETNVEGVNEKGARFALVQPLLRRFFSEAEALAFHQQFLDRFDELLRLKAGDSRKTAPPA